MARENDLKRIAVINLVPQIHGVVVMVVVLDFAQQHLRCHAANVKTRGDHAGEAWDHLPAHFQPVKTGN